MKPYVALTCLSILAWGSVPQSAAAADKRGDVPQQMANCLYERYPARAEQLLRSTSAGTAESAYVSLLDEPLCVSKVVGDHEFTPDDALGSIHLMRGMLAEQAIAASRAQVQALAALPVQQKGYARPWSAASGRNPAVDEMVACVADTNPAGILALLKTTPGSSEEGAAMSELDGSIKGCLSAKLKLAVGTRMVRAALADALYQRALNPALSVAQAQGTPH